MVVPEGRNVEQVHRSLKVTEEVDNVVKETNRLLASISGGE